MITVARIKSLLATELIESLSENDNTIIDDLITKNDGYVSNLLGDINEDVKDYLVEQLVLRDLYQRFGYMDLAENYGRTVENMITKIGSGKIYKKESSSSVVYTSRKRIFTDDEFEKW